MNGATTEEDHISRKISIVLLLTQYSTIVPNKDFKKINTKNAEVRATRVTRNATGKENNNGQRNPATGHKDKRNKGGKYVLSQARHDYLIAKEAKYEDLLQRIVQKTSELEEKNQTIQELEQEVEKVRGLENELEEEKKKVVALNTKLSGYAVALNRTGGTAVSELNEALVNHCKTLTKTRLFRTYKFLAEESELIEGMEEIHKYIPVTMDITEQVFIKDYKGIVRKALNEARSYVQSEGKKAAKGKVFDLVLPTLYL